MAVTLLGYLENLILYQFGAYACFDLKTRMPWIQIAGAGMCALLAAVSELLMPVNVSDVSLSITSYGVMLCVVFLALKEEGRKRFWHLGVLWVLIFGMETVFYAAPFLQLFPGMLVLLCILALRRCVPEEVKEKIRNLIPVIFFAGIGVCFILQPVWEVFYSAGLEGRDDFLLPGAGEQLRLMIWFFGMLVLYLWHQNRKNKAAQRQEAELYAAQKEYYEILLRKEEDTKRFRHDFVNHLVCIRELSRERNWEKIDRYLDGLQRETEPMQKKMYHTGDDVLDALTEYLLRELGEEVFVKVESHLERRIAVAPVKLCAIYSNLLKNAVEEIRRCGKERRRELFIGLWSDAEWVKIEIRNSLSHPKPDLSKTAKKDQKNHGYGLQNVQEKVKEMKGSVSFRDDEERFCVEVNLPNKETA